MFRIVIFLLHAITNVYLMLVIYSDKLTET